MAGALGSNIEVRNAKFVLLNNQSLITNQPSVVLDIQVEAA